MVEANRLLDESSLYQEPVVEKPKEKFGDVLRDIMSASGTRLTWQQAASLAEIGRSTFKRLVNGQLRPPRSVEFLRRIAGLPGVTEQHLERLLSAADAPNILAVVSHHMRVGEETEHRAELVNDDGISILFGVRLDFAQYSEAELDLLTAQIKKQIEGTVQMFDAFKGLRQSNDLPQDISTASGSLQ